MGRGHTSAVIPIPCSNGVIRYKFIDIWDSTDRPVGDYWILPLERMPEWKKLPASPPDDLAAGNRVVHKVLGEGVIIGVNGSLLSIGFGKNGVRRLNRSWVEQNCTPMA